MSATTEAQQRNSILIVDLARWYGGVDVRVLDMARALHGRSTYTVATLAHSTLHQRLEAEGLSALPLPYGRSDPRLLQALRRAIREHGYNVVDAHNPQSQFWGLLAGRLERVPVMVSSVHTIYPIIPGGWKGKLYEQVLRLNAGWGCRFVTVSSSIVDYLRGLGIAPQRIALIYNGVRPQAPIAPERDLSLRASFGWGPDEYVVVVVGRLETQKGHTYLLQALNQVVAERRQIRCLIVGEGRLRPSLTEQARQLGLEEYVHFTGFRSDIGDILRACDLFCLPSLTEGLPFALLEACALGLPSLVSNVDGMGELFDHQETSYLVPSTDVMALAQGLRWFVDHPQAAVGIGSNAYRLVQERLNPETMIAETLAVYQAPGQ